MSKKKTVIGLLLACICAGLAVSHVTFDVSAEQAEVVGCDIETNYNYGDEFSIPDGKVSYKGVEKDAESTYIVFPSGKANESQKIILSEEGKYEVVFQAGFGRAKVSAKKSFIVNKRLLAVNDDKSTAEIVDNKIQVSLVSDDVFTYNEAIDLSELKKDTPLLNIEFNPNSIGTADAVTVNVRFTDLYDENNYVTVKMKKAGGDGVVYLSAGAANQSSVGVENWEDPSKTTIYSNSKYGTPVYCSMVGMPVSSLDEQLKLYFDYEEKAFYADREVYSGGKNRMVADLDDVTYFGSELWEGFTTGEVKMTVFAESYQASSCNFIIAQINGQSDFEETGDVEAPKIALDTAYDVNALPSALVGKEYKIFNAKAFDKYDGQLEVTSSVYSKYYSESPVKVSVADGVFTPYKEGVYVIEYTATDCSGNVATECVKVNAVKGEGLQAELKDVVTETDTGVVVKVMSGIDYRDNSGNVSYSVKAKNKSTDEEVKIDNDTMEFIPMSDGDWEVNVTIKDYVSNVSKNFTVKANHTDQPQVFDTVAVPKYFIQGATYEMSGLSGYDFSSGKGVKKDMDIFVTESDGTEKKLDGKEYTPEHNGTVTITYRLTIDDKVCEKVYTAVVMDVGYTGSLDLSRFFVTTEGSATSESSATCVTYTMQKDTKFDFINFVQVKKLTFSFQVGEKNQYNRIHLYLTDTVTGKMVKLSYRRTEEGSAFSVNDGVEFALAASFDGMDRNFSLEFNNDTFIATANSTVSVKIDKFLDGSAFDGFSNSQAVFSIAVEGVSGRAQLAVNNINEHSINNTKMDRFAPQIIVETNAGDRGFGEEVTLSGAFVYDTVNPMCTLTLEITDPDGKYVKSKDKISLDGKQDATKDYTIVLEKYGDYTIQYVATDGQGKSTEYVYAITSKDVTNPELTLKSHKTSAKKGSEIKVAKTKVKDNITEECLVYVYVFDPDDVVVEMTDGKFKATKSGIYTVRYMALDDSSNCAFASYKIDVK